jgi:hypothetical protein
MTLYKHLKCWEIISCNHLECLARIEPQTSCWQLAKKFQSFHYVSNTCQDCIVNLLQHGAPIFSKKEIEEIVNHRVNSEKIGTSYFACIQTTYPTS